MACCQRISGNACGWPVGFRNVLVHGYRDVDDEIVRARLADLSDLESFVVEVTEWLRPADG